MSEPIDGVSRSGIPYRRGSGPNLLGGLTVAWDVLPDCPACGKPTGEKCFMVIGDKECAKITPHKERLPEVDVVGDALEPDEEAATVDASAPTPPGEGHRTGTGGPDAPGASEGLDAAIEAAARAMREDNRTRRASPDFDPPAFDELPDEVQEHHRLLAAAAVRAAEPILRQAVAEEIARSIELRELNAGFGLTSDDEAKAMDALIATVREDAAIAREVGRGQ